MSHIALVGAGLVGSSWAVVFARAGREVVLYDADATASERALRFARSVLDEAVAAERGSRRAENEATHRIRVARSLEDAVDGAAYIQESAPERVEIKRQLYDVLDGVAAPETIIGSSTSGLPASSFTERLTHRERCLVVHPINPPHLIPLVEIVPAPWTEASVVDTSMQLMRDVGQSPIALSREINGFVVNRLQSALLAESFRLVEDGVCSPEAVDRAVSDGLGLRWFFMGPFETIDLNAPNGIAEYCRNLGPMYHALAHEQSDPRPWSPELVNAVETVLRERTPAHQLPDRRAWRDRYLSILQELKQDGTTSVPRRPDRPGK